MSIVASVAQMLAYDVRQRTDRRTENDTKATPARRTS